MAELITLDLVTGELSTSEFTPPPPPPQQFKTQMASLEYLDRFTEEEQLAVAEAAMSNPVVNLWYMRMGMAEYIDVTDPRVGQGIDALIAAGLLDEGRKEALLQPIPI